mgnify:CR=1 FL=1
MDFVNLRFIKALKRLMNTVEEQAKDTNYEKNLKVSFYTFYRTATELERGHMQNAWGTGMIKAGFRPSDEPTSHAYNIPGNAMLCTYMQLLAEVVLPKLSANSVFKKEVDVLMNRMSKMAQSVR